jgi:peptidoglycan hydrolase-like protein with peptidoglycan-binding domain
MAFDKEALDGIKAEAKRLGVEWQALAAVAEIESGGRPLWDGLCPIRIEGHYFYKRLLGAKRRTAVDQRLASPRAGAVRNSAKMAARYAMLKRMSNIDENAALESCSWGLGQVMGSHWKSLGYPSVKALVKEAKDSVSGQVRLMGRFIEKNGLVDELQAKDWARFARGYNGPNYRRYSYDTKMAKAYEAFLYGSVAETKTVIRSDDILERGDKGTEVSALQEKLADFGYYDGFVDGIFGGATELAVMDFQTDAGILIDGRAGPVTKSRLRSWTRSKAKKKDVKITGRADVVYRNQHAIRNRPCTSYLEVTLSTAIYDVYGPGYLGQIYSGGQARRGTPGKRTGSVRHDDYGKGGRALDAYIVNKAGKRLSGLELARLGQYWLAMKYGGCGLEMARGGIHLDEWKRPPRGGGLLWTYPYLNKQPWGAEVRQMLVDGSKGRKPPLHKR